MISCQVGGDSSRPRFGSISPDSIFKAVDFPVPFLPIRPVTRPGCGTGRRYSLNWFGPYRWLHSPSISSGRFTIEMALKGHFFTQMPQPVQRRSKIVALSEPFSKIIASILDLTCGQYLLQTSSQSFGLQRSRSRTATLTIGCHKSVREDHQSKKCVA